MLASNSQSNTSKRTFRNDPKLKKVFVLEKQGGWYVTILSAFQKESLPQRQNRKNYE
jgi:hypothetical protein